MDVRLAYYENEKEHMRKEENCNITPLYIQAPGSIYLISSVVIHKGVEVVVVRVCPTVNAVSV